ncbi:MAG: hypothetical protein WCD70_02850 [Alphaproteobacteria bacterium]
MSTSYLKNLFEMSLMDMAVSTSSLSCRLSNVCRGHLFKIQWDKDVECITEERRLAFLELKKILFDDVGVIVEELRQKEQKNYARMGGSMTEQQLANLISYDSVRKQLHWRKAKRAATLMCEVYRDLSWSLDRQEEKRIESNLRASREFTRNAA